MNSSRYRRIAIVGASGQLGVELVKRLGDLACALRRPQFDVCDSESVRLGLESASPDLVINTAAYNFVDKAESEPQVAYEVNGLGPRHLAQACAERSIPLLHVSTDYVFGLDTASKPHSETDAPGPVSAYGISKLTGEYFVRSICPKHFVVRTCGLYGNAETAGKGNFVKTMLRLGRERGHVRVVDDQQCTPTSASDLADGLVRLIETEAYGLYHLTNSGATTWLEFAREIFTAAGLTVTSEAISTREFGAKANRPAYSVLDCRRAAEAAGICLPPWQDAVARYLQTLPT